MEVSFREGKIGYRRFLFVSWWKMKPQKSKKWFKNRYGQHNKLGSFGNQKQAIKTLGSPYVNSVGWVIWLVG